MASRYSAALEPCGTSANTATSSDNIMVRLMCEPPGENLKPKDSVAFAGTTCPAIIGRVVEADWIITGLPKSEGCILVAMESGPIFYSPLICSGVLPCYGAAQG